MHQHLMCLLKYSIKVQFVNIKKMAALFKKWPAHEILVLIVLSIRRTCLEVAAHVDSLA